MIMICKVKGCNRDTEFDIDFICNYHWKMREKEATIAELIHDRLSNLDWYNHHGCFQWHDHKEGNL